MVGAAHRRPHQRRQQRGESGRFTAVAQSHPRRAVGFGIPGVGGLHRKRALPRAHDQGLAGDQLHEFVGVAQRAAKEPGNELDLRADLKRRWRLPLDRVDVVVPLGSVRRVAGIGRDRVGRSGDDDLGLDVNVDPATLPIHFAAVLRRPERADDQTSLGWAIAHSAADAARCPIAEVAHICTAASRSAGSLPVTVRVILTPWPVPSANSSGGARQVHRSVRHRMCLGTAHRTRPAGALLPELVPLEIDSGSRTPFSRPRR